ncbi:hypothetical protein D3C84_1207840 [compost metagenome]
MRIAVEVCIGSVAGKSVLVCQPFIGSLSTDLSAFNTLSQFERYTYKHLGNAIAHDLLRRSLSSSRALRKFIHLRPCDSG